jgi:hypothetical protein
VRLGFFQKKLKKGLKLDFAIAGGDLYIKDFTDPSK